MIAFLALTAVGLAVLWLGLYHVHWIHVRRRFVTVSPGYLYQTGAMPALRLLALARRLRISTVVDLRVATDPNVERERRMLERHGIRHVSIPCDREPSRDQIGRFLDVAEGERARGRPMLVHCKDGEGRAVAFSALYRIEFDGWTPDAAYLGSRRLPPLLQFLRHVVPRAGLMSRTNPKTRLILEYRPVRGGAGRDGGRAQG